MAQQHLRFRYSQNTSRQVRLGPALLRAQEDAEEQEQQCSHSITLALGHTRAQEHSQHSQSATLALVDTRTQPCAHSATRTLSRKHRRRRSHRHEPNRRNRKEGNVSVAYRIRLQLHRKVRMQNQSTSDRSVERCKLRRYT